MENFPKRINEASIELAGHIARVDTLRDKIRTTEMLNLDRVLRETTEGGKPLYSNDKAREVALGMRLFLDEKYNADKRAL